MYKNIKFIINKTNFIQSQIKIDIKTFICVQLNYNFSNKFSRINWCMCTINDKFSFLIEKYFDPHDGNLCIDQPYEFSYK